MRKDALEMRLRTCAAAELRVLARAQRRRDADDRYLRSVPYIRLVDEFMPFLLVARLRRHGLHVFDDRRPVLYCVDDYFCAICDAATTERYQAVCLLLTHVVDYGDQIVPWRVRSDAEPGTYMVGSQCLLKILDISCLLVQTW